MRCLVGLLLVVMVEPWLPVNGQGNAGKAKDKQHNAQDKKQPVANTGPSGGPGNVTDVNKPRSDGDKDRKADEPNGYLSTLVSPNNLPNLILAVIGIVGIIVAFCTLKWLGVQTRYVGHQAFLMRQQFKLASKQRIESNQSSFDTLAALNRQITALGEQGDLMKRQVAAMERETEAAYRPWLSAEIKPDSELVFDMNEMADDPGAILDIDVVIKNTGQTPAMHVTVTGILTTQSRFDDISAHVNAERRGSVIFPGEELPPEKSFGRIPKSEIDSFICADEKPRGVKLRLCVLVDYQSSFMEKRHCTRYDFMLMSRVNERNAIYFPPDGSYPVRLRLIDRSFT